MEAILRLKMTLYTMRLRTSRRILLVDHLSTLTPCQALLPQQTVSRSLAL
jgi:hypothetical protein